MQSLSLAQARRLALAAQGLHRRRPSASSPDRRHLRSVLQRTGLLQIDSVNVLQRAHYLPAFSRVGGYRTDLLDRMAFRDRELFEYWGHEASLLPVALHPLLRWRMRRAEEQFETWGRMAQFAREQPGYIDHVLGLVRERGPLTAGELAVEEKRSKDDWGWNWSKEKLALEFLFWSGRITTAERRNFERVYDVPERVIPREILDLPTPTEEDAHRELLALAAVSCGVGTVGDLADYFRIRTPLARPRVAELVEAGRLEEVTVEGWRQPAYVATGATIPRRAGGRALLVPFDPLIWERDRTERLFGFRYRIEIYVPAAKRVHGYYVLPFLLGDRLAARVDLKADRQRRTLLVQAAYAELHAPADTAEELAAELRDLADWLALETVEVRRRGDLAPALAAVVGGTTQSRAHTTAARRASTSSSGRRVETSQ
ncbi:MAG TPA: crosslink repair DNA glycosylase YcaQ family protein [Mycobacteriales bacterium]|nr:crosslink repair DNA glycosylase YcaQ family protein [Mycobacteriales bacterium]